MERIDRNYFAIRIGAMSGLKGEERMKRRMDIAHIFPALLTVFLCAAASQVHSESLPAREEVLEVVYPKASVEGKTIFLTSQEMERVSRVSGAEIPSALVARYTLQRDGRVIGRAYVDTHVVRTKKQSLLICLDANGLVKRVEVTAFQEPPEYNLSERWYDQYSKKGIRDDLRLEQGIRPITGATLTSISASQAIRRALAIDKVLQETRNSEE